MDESYKDVYLNAIPSTDMNYSLGENDMSITIPEVESALVKCEATDPEYLPLRGYRSGKRSALIEV